MGIDRYTVQRRTTVVRNRSFFTIIILIALALFAVGAFVGACAPAPTPVPPTLLPQTEANKALVRQYYDQVLGAGNLNAIDELVSPNYKRYLSGGAAPLDAAANKQRLAGLRAAFPDMKPTIEDLVAQGDRVASRVTVRATHQSAFQGIAPTGKPVTITALEIIRIENGKFVEQWGGPDLLNVVQQLGGVISAAP
jgi:predicted ester cyclase